MSLWTKLVSDHTGKVVRQAVAAFAAIALVAVSIEAVCACLTPNDDRGCCCSKPIVSTTAVQGSTCGNACLRAHSRAPVGETLGVPDSGPPSAPVVSVAAVHHRLAGAAAPAQVADSPPLILLSPHSILRI